MSRVLSQTHRHTEADTGQEKHESGLIFSMSHAHAQMLLLFSALIRYLCKKKYFLIFLLDPSRFGLLPGDDPSMDPPCGPTLI